jgi:hypothetical protein
MIFGLIAGYYAGSKDVDVVVVGGGGRDGVVESAIVAVITATTALQNVVPSGVEGRPRP